MDVLKHPPTVTCLASEAKKVCDAYWKKEISESELKDLVLHWATYEKCKLFKNKDFNPTVKKILGKKRIELLQKMLNGE